MKIRFYSWEDCPIGYRSFSPVRSWFETNKVTLVMVVVGPFDEGNAQAKVKKFLSSMFKKQPTDKVKGFLDKVPTVVYFWTEDI